MTKLLTKTSPLTLKILRLVKGLNKFTIDDIQRLLSEEENEILISLKELEENSIIKKISDTEYLFINIKIPEPIHYKTRDYMDKTIFGEWLTVEDVCKITGETPQAVKRKCKINEYENTYEKDGKFSVYFIKASSLGDKVNILNNELGIKFTQGQLNLLLDNIENYKTIQIETILDSQADWEFYHRCSEVVQKLLIKHLVLFKLIGNLTISEIKATIKIIAKRYPYYKMNEQWYRRKYNRFKENGLAGLYNNQLSTVNKEVYEAFKKFYLSQNGYTQEEAYELLKQQFNVDALPSLAVISHRLRKEYSREAIKKIKSIPKQHKRKYTKKPRKVEDIAFKEAAEKYFNSIQNDNEAINNQNKRYCTKLINYFQNYKLNEIVEEEIINFKKEMFSQGNTMLTIKILIRLLLNILLVYGVKIKKHIALHNTRQIQLLNLEEIKNIISNNSPEAWIIGLGLRLKEIEVLEYEDIDFQNQLATISKIRHNERSHKFYAQKQTRYVKIPSNLIGKLNSQSKGIIFPNIHIDNYEQLIFAHVMLMQLNNVPMNIIAKNMGYNGIYEFYDLFSQAFPKTLNQDFDIFERIL